jgi:hypothetical protein
MQSALDYGNGASTPSLKLKSLSPWDLIHRKPRFNAFSRSSLQSNWMHC